MKRARLALRLASWLAIIFLTGVAILVTFFRFVLLPQINDFREDVESAFSAQLHQPVSIGRIEGRMQGIRPRLELYDFAIKDASGRPALSLDNVVGVLGWTSLWRRSLRFYLLEVNAPVLAVRRDVEGHFFVAGLLVKDNRSVPDISAWILDQYNLVIRDARVTWTDELRQAPPLVLEHLNLQLKQTVVGHRFGVTALPPATLAAKIDLRGNFRGDSVNQIEQWNGELYGNVDYADLAGWHAWIDYPGELPRGRGALRTWLDLAGPQLAIVGNMKAVNHHPHRR